MIFAQSKEPCPIAQQCVLISTKVTDIIDNEDISSLYVTKLWKIFIVKELQCLYGEYEQINKNHND